MAEKIRIKDIAERAGVSVGTVDRVLHDRPNVSKPARKKVEQALKEMNYQPNMYASALAYNKSVYLLHAAAKARVGGLLGGDRRRGTKMRGHQARLPHRRGNQFLRTLQR